MHAYRPRLLIMVKEPRPGRVKTRLGAGIGMGPAARWFRRESGALIHRLSADPRWETILAVAPDSAALESRVWPAHLRRWPQGGGDLGDRMRRVFRAMPPGPVLIIGADIPGISRRDIAAGFRALGSADAVFGPADDGGYWLIGLSRTRRAAPRSLFEGVRWSTEHALADTERSLAGARIAHLRTL
ncbi:MAG: TIGR04282 family arsenosugar biosynthesis glycosyltransferase, partial [Pseudomonadota bacterium]